MTSLQFFAQFCANVRQLLKFSMDTKFGIYSTLVDCSTEIFQRKSFDEFCFHRCFRESSLEITKRAQHCVLLIHMLSCFFFRITQVYLRSAGCKVYKGQFVKLMSDKNVRKHPKSSRFVCIKSSFQFIHNLYLLIEIPRCLEIPLKE